MGQPLIGRSLYGPRKEASFADGRLNALALCLPKSLGVHEVISALSALEANDP